jgi:hypothetical protein
VNPETDAVMHLRLGDVSETICQTKCVLNKLFLDKEAVKYWWQNDETKELVFDLKDQREGDNMWRKSDYLMSLKFYENTIPELRNKGIMKVTIVSGSHYDWMDFKNSSYFIRKVAELYKLNGFEVEVKVGAELTPDNAIMFASQHKTFIRSAGGYSEMLEFAVKSLNGEENSTIIARSKQEKVDNMWNGGNEILSFVRRYLLLDDTMYYSTENGEPKNFDKLDRMDVKHQIRIRELENGLNP